MSPTQTRFPVGSEILPTDAMPDAVRGEVIDSICTVSGYGPWEGTINVKIGDGRKPESTWSAELWKPLIEEDEES